MSELDEERAYAERCREAVQAMLDGARDNVIVGETVAGDRYSAERLGRHLKSLAKELSEQPNGPPFFGRLDFAGAAEAGDHQGRRYYLGRRHISCHSGRPPMVIDWRAPVARTFYQASAHEPHGLAKRRRFGWAALVLSGFEDERLDLGKDLGTSSRIVAAEIERPRVGPMRDIVATIRPEQDALVRADLGVSICVQGAPGTGKTAVGLHRAAYLLYAHRRRLERGGVLVLGPSRAFLTYISAVLPALGEVDVEQTTIDQLLGVATPASPASTPPPSAGTRAHGPASSTGVPHVGMGGSRSGASSISVLAAAPAAGGEDAGAVVKHDVRMAEVLRRALYARVRKPVEPIVVAEGSQRWRVAVEEFRRVVDDTRREAVHYSVGRERVLSRLVAMVRRQAEARGGTPGAAWERAMARKVRPFLAEVWPAVRPEEVVAGLLGDAGALASAASGVLTSEEQKLILWPKPVKSPKSVRWSAADAVLIDEVAGLLERQQGYGHVIVDEAQDLSAMQCRAVARRSEHGSITVLGDLAQGTTPWAALTWQEHLTHLGRPEAEVVALTTGYRVPAAVVTMANRLLAALPAQVPPTESFRSDGRLRLHRVGDVKAGVVEAVREALTHEGSIALIAADGAVSDLATALVDGAGGLSDAGREMPGRQGSDPAENSESRQTVALGPVENETVVPGPVENKTVAPGPVEKSESRLTVVPASMAKGLEFDHVVVVEPADIVDAEVQGLNRLYVVLTRAVSRLDVIHTRDLPSFIRG
ncbi:HelD family protein [Sinosporangium siamense]|uniref:DNA helicase n=1 Tax=Sinosporangium siamense TaxID=1367973 RepID=A0A919RGI6_9ACTN|nr:AAA family ATPase [Sinosporangium siamense]GII93448.1 DNA helicase [Sinosporangium siamense]